MRLAILLRSVACGIGAAAVCGSLLMAVGVGVEGGADPVLLAVVVVVAALYGAVLGAVAGVLSGVAAIVVLAVCRSGPTPARVAQVVLCTSVTGVYGALLPPGTTEDVLRVAVAAVTAALAWWLSGWTVADVVRRPAARPR